MFVFSGYVMYHTTTTDRKWTRIMAAYLMEHPAAGFTVFTAILVMSTPSLFPSACWKKKIYGRTLHSWKMLTAALSECLLLSPDNLE